MAKSYKRLNFCSINIFVLLRKKTTLSKISIWVKTFLFLAPSYTMQRKIISSLFGLNLFCSCCRTGFRDILSWKWNIVDIQTSIPALPSSSCTYDDSEQRSERVVFFHALSSRFRISRMIYSWFKGLKEIFPWFSPKKWNFQNWWIRKFCTVCPTYFDQIEKKNQWNLCKLREHASIVDNISFWKF